MIQPLFLEENAKLFKDQDVVTLASEIQRRGVAVLYDQKFTATEWVQFMKRFGSCEILDEFMSPESHPEIARVTAARDNMDNKVGMFGVGELGWHSNGNSRHNVDKILVGLYCVRSDLNSTLSICQTSSPFYALPDKEKKYWESIKIRLEFRNNTVYQLSEEDPEFQFMSRQRGSIRRLVGKHPVTGQYYFYFPYHFIVKAWQNGCVIDHVKMIEKLKKIIFQSKYQFHFVFQKNDVVLMDQFTTLHRRTPVSQDRLLWRVATNYASLNSNLSATLERKHNLGVTST